MHINNYVIVYIVAVFCYRVFVLVTNFTREIKEKMSSGTRSPLSDKKKQ